MTTNFSEAFNSDLKGSQNVLIIAYVEMTFYRVNNYFILRRKSTFMRLSEDATYPSQISTKLRAYGVSNFQQDLIEVKTYQPRNLNKGGYIQLVDLQSDNHVPKTSTVRVQTTISCTKGVEGLKRVDY